MRHQHSQPPYNKCLFTFSTRLFPHVSSSHRLPLSISVSVRGGCVSMATGFATGLWEVRECASSKAKFICRQNQDTSLSPEPPVPQPTPSLSGSCPSGWKSNSNLRYCYKVHPSGASRHHHSPWSVWISVTLRVSLISFILPWTKMASANIWIINNILLISVYDQSRMTSVIKVI